MRSLNLVIAILFLVSSAFLFTGCKDEESEAGQGRVNVKLTDAPIDDANVEGVYVTVAEVWIDGQKVEGFSKKTIELSAYQEGNAVLLISDTLNAGAYNDVSLVLDFETDESGNSPGCFLLTENVVKHNLAFSSEKSAKIDLSKDFSVTSDGTTDLVIDFDLRKAIKYDNSFDGESDYSFVAQTELSSALRTVVEGNSGTIAGKITESAATGDMLIVYAYHKGEFNEEVETTGQGSGNLLFVNAVTSAEVNADNKYKLSFLEEGDYELHIAAFENDSNGKPVFSSRVEASSVGSAVLLNNVSVEANADVSLNINITGLLGI